MDRYLDIQLLPDPEFPPEQLMSALFSKLHRCLVRRRSDDIGISFPEVDPTRPNLGRVLRLHGAGESLKNIMETPWLEGMRDHVRVSRVEQVPDHAEHRRVRRVQAKSNAERIRRRQMKRHQLTEEEAKKRIPDTIEEALLLPYVIIESASTRNRFRLFIDHRTAPQPVAGRFNGYGLSDSATVPWF